MRILHTMLRTGDLDRSIAFYADVLPELLDAREESRTLRIWTPACATGEETHSIAMLVHRALELLRATSPPPQDR